MKAIGGIYNGEVHDAMAKLRDAHELDVLDLHVLLDLRAQDCVRPHGKGLHWPPLPTQPPLLELAWSHRLRRPNVTFPINQQCEFALYSPWYL
jgi:hypothetical protein